MKNIKNPLKITSTTLRDAHQSLLATRLHTEDMIEVCKIIDDIGYFSVEMWGGATFDACIRFTGEDPWERITTLKKYMPKTPFQMLLRGQNCVGYRHYADDVVEAFIERASYRGIDIFRVFDALNDPRNIEFAIKMVKKYKKIAEGCICYTTSPIHNIDSFVNLAQELKDMGSDLICIKDMAGLLDPYIAYELTLKLKEKIKLPIHLHTHSTTGFSVATYLKAAEAGVDIVDCAISPLSMDTSQPAEETIIAIFKGTERDTNLDLHKLRIIASHFEKVRKEKYSSYESGFFGIDSRILEAQVPGGMLSNMMNQLKEMNALDKFDKVMEELPKVREDLGFIPLVTPTSQIVGVQAVMNVISGQRYKVVSEETKQLVKGMYGRTPAPIKDEIKKLIIGDEEILTKRPADYLEPELPKLDKENISYLKTIEDKLIYVMFPKASIPFFEAREKGKLHEFKEKLWKKPEIKSETSTKQDKTIDKKTYRYNVKIENQIFEVIISEDEINEQETIKSISKITKKDDIEKSDNLKTYELKSELPGVITEVFVEEGMKIKKGDRLFVIEAMKMFNDITSPVDGIIEKLSVDIDSKVEIGTLLTKIKYL